ncbi:MAG: hypothetical protein MUE34_01340 [Acidimicrobiales bacterium]|jgi:hypothetical protein|nr:hypothetical protein [Acidimicrobiales bacterium]
MATIRTEITEIVTGLALLGYRRLDHALGVRPGHVANVTDDHYERLAAALAEGAHERDFAMAWENGRRFATAEEGLRGRPPWLVEWKGPHRPPGYEQIPADLRVDHVYLLSCKYGSDILTNASPSHLFDRVLADRRSSGRADWFLEVAPEAYQELYGACRSVLGDPALPERVAHLTREDRQRLKAGLRGAWPEEATDPYRWLAVAVSAASAERWRANLRDRSAREEMLWRLLRLQAAPYFVLGSAADGTPLHYRVGTPWDFRAAYELRAFDVWSDPSGQPRVRWRAEVRGGDGGDRSVEGHVEVRWSHGRFGGMPEAKVYLGTPHHDVPGYVPLR